MPIFVLSIVSKDFSLPELAAAYAIGICVNLLLALVFFTQQMRLYRNSAYLKIQKNLQKLGWRWNQIEARIEKNEGPEGLQLRQTNEIKKACQTYSLVSIGAVLLSWAGMFLLVLIWISVEKLAKSREEKCLFASRLAEVDLDVTEIEDICRRLGVV